PITLPQRNFKTIVMSTDVQDSIHSSKPISRNSGPTPISHDPDTTRSLERYREEVLRLKLALQNRRKEWGSFDFRELGSIPENEDITILQSEVEKVLDAKKNSLANKTAWTTVKSIIEQGYMALTPFAKTFLSVAKNAQSVYLYISTLT